MICASSAGSQALTGYVRQDSTRHPIADADVVLQGLGRTVRTDATGAFRFGEVQPGTRTLQVRRVGYEQLDTVLSLAADLGGCGAIVIWSRRYR